MTSLLAIIFNILSNAAGFGSRWLLNVLLIGALGVSEYGKFSTEFALMSLVCIATCYGASILMFQVREHSETWVALNTSLMISSVAFIFIFSLGFISTSFINYETTAPIFLGFCFALNYLISYFLKTNYKYFLDFVYCTITAALVVGVAILPRFWPLRSTTIIWSLSLAVGSVALVAYGLLLYSRRHSMRHILSIMGHVGLIRKSLAERLPYAANEIYSALFSTAPVIFLGHLSSEKDAGIFKAFFTLLMPMLILSPIIIQVYLPRLSRLQGNLAFRYSVQRLIIANATLGVLMMSLLFVLGKPTAYLLYGARSESIWTEQQVLFMLGATLPFWYIKGACEAALTAAGYQLMRTRILRDAAFLLCSGLVGVIAWGVIWAALAYSTAVIIGTAALFVATLRILNDDSIDPADSHQ